MGFSVVFTLQRLAVCVLGAILGLIVGAMPGIGSLAGCALLLPLTYKFEPKAAIIMLGALYYSNMYGGAFSAILLNVPGDSPAVMTTLPVVAIDDAMVNAAVRLGSRVGLLATAESTLGPSRSALEAAAKAIGKEMDIQVLCDPEAIRALKAGDRDDHDARVLKLAEKLTDRDVIVLAQASMAHMEGPVAAHTGLPTLSSVDRCVAQVRAILEEAK